MSTRRPTFAEIADKLECMASNAAADEGSLVVKESDICALRAAAEHERILAHGSDPRTCRVLKSGAVVAIGSAGEEEEK